MDSDETTGPTEVGPEERIRATVETVSERGTKAADEIAEALGQVRSAATNATSTFTNELARLGDLIAQLQGRAADVQGILDAATTSKAAIDSARSAAEENQKLSLLHADESARSKTEAAAASSAASEARAAADSALTQINTLRTEVAEHNREAAASDKTLAGLAAKAGGVDQNLKKYEGELEALLGSSKEQADALLKRIRSLLPEGTSAGLATAFEQRRKKLQFSRRLWMVLFVACLGVLGFVSLAAADLLEVAWIKPIKPLTQTGDWHEFALSLARRLVSVAAPLWLALVSSSQLRSLLRLEEEYAHKVAMSIAFEGYKREVGEITGKEGLLAALTEAVIETLKTPPVRLFDAKRSAETPLEVAADGFAKSVDALGGFAEKVAGAAQKLGRK